MSGNELAGNRLSTPSTLRHDFASRPAFFQGPETSNFWFSGASPAPLAICQECQLHKAIHASLSLPLSVQCYYHAHTPAAHDGPQTGMQGSASRDSVLPVSRIFNMASRSRPQASQTDWDTDFAQDYNICVDIAIGVFCTVKALLETGESKERGRKLMDEMITTACRNKDRRLQLPLKRLLAVMMRDLLKVEVKQDFFKEEISTPRFGSSADPETPPPTKRSRTESRESVYTANSEVGGSTLRDEDFLIDNDGKQVVVFDCMHETKQTLTFGFEVEDWTLGVFTVARQELLFAYFPGVLSRTRLLTGTHAEETVSIQKKFPGIIADKQYLYIFGGEGSASAHKFHIETFAKKHIEAMAHPRSCFRPCLYQNNIYLCGGGVPTCEMYFTQEDVFLLLDTWTLPENIRMFASVQGEVLVLAGDGPHGRFVVELAAGIPSQKRIRKVYTLSWGRGVAVRGQRMFSILSGKVYYSNFKTFSQWVCHPQTN